MSKDYNDIDKQTINVDDNMEIENEYKFDDKMEEDNLENYKNYEKPPTFKIENAQNSNSELKNFNEKNSKLIINELNSWKKSEQIKFKLYLKNLEIDFMNKLAEDSASKEDKRDKELKQSLNELNSLINKCKKKANELETRENKIALIEEEIKLKLNEMSRNITSKNEELILITKKSKDDKAILEKEIANLKKLLQTKNQEFSDLEKLYKTYKTEIEDSPMSNLRIELNRKTLEIEELKKDKLKLEDENQKLTNSVKVIKNELSNVKKQHEKEKDLMYKQKLEEIEKLRFEIYNQKQSQVELQELSNMKNMIGKLKVNENKEKNNSIQRQYRVVTIENNNLNKGGIFESNQFNSGNSGFGTNYNELKEAELERLSKNRSQLLESGMYNESDQLIINIDSQIERLIRNEI